jgi:hypothetical protein
MKKARISAGFVVLLAVLCFFPSMGWAQTTWPVDCDVTTITAYINNNPLIQPGDTLAISSICNDNVTVTIAGLILDGQTSASISAASTTLPVVTVAAPGVTIKRFSNIGGGNYAEMAGIQVSNSASAYIISNYIQDNGSHGVQVTDSASALIENNHILSNKSAGVLVASSASASIVSNYIQDNQGTGIIVRDNSSAHIGFIYDSDKTPSPNYILQNGEGVDVIRASCARITGNTIAGNGGNGGIIVDRVSQADIAGNTIGSYPGTHTTYGQLYGIYVSGNSGVNLGDFKPESFFGDPNYTNTAYKNTQYAIVCTNGGYVAGYLGSLAGSAKTPTSFATNCVNALISTNTVIGNWTVASYTSTTDEPIFLGSTVTFYSDGSGAYFDNTNTQQFVDADTPFWTIKGTTLTMMLVEGTLSGTIKFTDSDHVTYTFTDSGYATNPKTKFTLNLTRQP